MNDEISKEAVVMVVRAIKFEGTELRHSFERLTHEMQSDIKYERRTRKAEKERLASIAKENAPGTVKIRDLLKSGEEIVSTELHDDEIKKFERELKKNGVR